jgi:hypothetical protein
VSTVLRLTEEEIEAASLVGIVVPQYPISCFILYGNQTAHLDTNPMARIKQGTVHAVKKWLQYRTEIKWS